MSKLEHINAHQDESHKEQAEFENSMIEGIGIEMVEMVSTPYTLDESSVDKLSTPMSLPLEGVLNIIDMSHAYEEALTLTEGNNPSEDGSIVHDIAETTDLEEDDLGWPIALQKRVRSFQTSVRYPIVSHGKLGSQHKTFMTTLGKVFVPKGVEEALRDPGWKSDMDEEMCALEKNDTWKFVSLPKGKRIIGCHWVHSRI